MGALGGHSCADRGFNYASRDGDGDCTGNSGGGSGRLVCLSGAGEGTVLRILQGASAGVSCNALGTLAAAEGASSFVYMQTSETSEASTIFAWNKAAGC